MAQILGPENGHVFETEKFQKCARQVTLPIASGNVFRRVFGHPGRPPDR
jgi:hypothetical protein